MNFSPNNALTSKAPFGASSKIKLVLLNTVSCEDIVLLIKLVVEKSLIYNGVTFTLLYFVSVSH